MTEKKNKNQKQNSSNLTSIHVKIPQDFLQEIDDFAKEFAFRNRTDAIRYLTALGIKYHKGILKDPKNL